MAARMAFLTDYDWVWKLADLMVEWLVFLSVANLVALLVFLLVEKLVEWKEEGRVVCLDSNMVEMLEMHWVVVKVMRRVASKAYFEVV